ncbi:MAG: hypothetical protein AAB316_07350, partial [Bacteroidota bacterium]
FKNPNHQTSGIGQVLSVMDEQMSKQTAIGIIDHDKKIVAHYYERFLTVKEENHLILKKHPQRNHHLIMVTPALEKFILKSAEECGIPASEIPFSEKRLKEISKKQNAGKDVLFLNFLHRIIQRKAPGTETMKAWIQEFLGDEY